MDHEPCGHLNVKKCSRLNVCKMLKVCGLCSYRSFCPLTKMTRCVDCKTYLHKQCVKAFRMQDTFCKISECVTRTSEYCTAAEITENEVTEDEIAGVKNIEAQISGLVPVEMSALDCNIIHSRCLNNIITETPNRQLALMVYEQKPAIVKFSAFTLFNYLIRQKELDFFHSNSMLVASPFNVKSHFTKFEEESERRKLHPVASPVPSPFHVKSRLTKDDYLKLSSTWVGLGKRQRNNYNARIVYSKSYYTRSGQAIILYLTS